MFVCGGTLIKIRKCFSETKNSKSGIIIIIILNSEEKKSNRKHKLAISNVSGLKWNTFLTS